MRAPSPTAKSATSVAGPTLDGSASVGDVTDVWTLVDDSDFIPDAERSVFDDMEGDGAGDLLIAGTTTDHETRSYHATVWHSDDLGASLSRVILPTLVEGIKSSVADVEYVPLESTVGRDGAITGVVAGSVGFGSGQRAAIWVLQGGDWSQLESDAFLSERREWTNRLSVGEDGELLVLGSATDETGDVHPVAWLSTDGVSWSRLPESFDDVDDTTLVDAAFGDADIVVIGHFIADSFNHSQVFVSSDGRSWERSAPSTFAGDGDVQVQSVPIGPSTVNGEGLVRRPPPVANHRRGRVINVVAQVIRRSTAPTRRPQSTNTSNGRGSRRFTAHRPHNTPGTMSSAVGASVRIRSTSSSPASAYPGTLSQLVAQNTAADVAA